jgi:uncharacterized membrane protein YuzA (DUF378 family)
MVTLISLIIVSVGIANWFTVGALQYDFIAGLFGSQANIFSRIVYVLVGIAGIFLAYSIIKNKGRLSLKNSTDKKLFEFNKPATVNTESSHDNSLDYDTESSYDNSIKNEHIQSKASHINDKNKLSSKNYYNENTKNNNLKH